MTSFLTRMATEATAALSDAYGHVMHGDDAGSSAKLVWVVHPTKVPIDINAELYEGVGEGGGGGGMGDVVGSPGGRSNGTSSNYLFTQKFDLGLTFLEINDRAYVKTVDPNSLAEKAGIQPQDCVQFACVVGGPQFDDLQLTNNNNNCSTISNNSNTSTSSKTKSSSRVYDGGSSRRNIQESREQEKQKLDAKATKFVIDCESKRGMRISYEDLRDLFAGCTLPPKGGGLGNHHQGGQYGNENDKINGALEKKDMITPPRNSEKQQQQQQQQQLNQTDDDYTIGSNSLLLADSVGGMFEPRSKRTNEIISSRRVPNMPDKRNVKNVTLNVTNAARHAAGRCFEGGDVSSVGGVTDNEDSDTDDYDYEEENNDTGMFSSSDNGKKKNKRRSGGQKGKGGGGSRRSSLPILDTPLSPIKSDNILSATVTSPSSSHRTRSGGSATFGNHHHHHHGGNDSIVEQSLYPVVMVFRRTVQRKRILSPTKGWGSTGLSLKGSLFGIPSFRMDDECDRAAALVRQLAPSKRSKGNKSTLGKHLAMHHDAMFDDNSTLGGGGTVATAATTSPGGGNGSNGVDGEDIEASTIRSCIQHAVGLGFVRLSKVVVGVSLQGGSGIIISRLPDGTWSAPSSIGVYGIGVGLQFGLEVADFMFIIQTHEGMEHFKRGGNFVVGGNIGAAVVNCGREAYGAASLGACTGRMPLDDQIPYDEMMDNERDDIASTVDESTYQSTMGESTTLRSARHQSSSSNKKKKKDGNNSDVAPMVAYAKSQGLYFGVSVDGLKFFTRNDINARTYKFSMLSEMPAEDILSGLVSPPSEAEDLYAALHSVEYTHEMTELPRPPEMLRRDSMNDWRFDRSIAAYKGEIIDQSHKKSQNFALYSFLTTLNGKESDAFALFETKFKKFLYGGVALQHLMPHVAPTRSGMTRREKRTLWLMLPEVGSLRLGFVSKNKDSRGDTSMDDITVASSVASSRVDDDYTASVDANVKLSRKYSVPLTDITALSQDPNVTVRLSPDDATEHLRVISIKDVTGKSMLFLANSKREAELLFCGLKLLLECETARLGVRGGVPLNEIGGKLGKNALSPLTARGSVKASSRSTRRHDRTEGGQRSVPRRMKEFLDDKSKYSSFGEPSSESDDSHTDEDKESVANEEADFAKVSERHQVPDGRQWSQLPGRSAMRQMASGNTSPRAAPMPQVAPTYLLGKAIFTDIATNISLPLPLAMCRVLLLDSSSPVNKTWEVGRSDADYQHGPWAFAPGSIREFEANSAQSEHHLISRGSMVGAQRIVSYNRKRNRELVRLSETIHVEKDDHQSLVFVVADQMPRRGFSAKARLYLQSFGNERCEARVVTEIRPVGKNLSDQSAVHKAFVLVLDEMRKRYGVEDKGLLSVFLDVYNSISIPGYVAPASPRRPQGSTTSPANKSQASITSFKDVLPSNQVGNSTAPRQLPVNKPPSPRNSAAFTKLPSPTQHSPTREQSIKEKRPSTPSVRTIDSKTVNGLPTKAPKLPTSPPTDDFADFSSFDDIPRNPVTVEVKPLPKIRLDLLPVPREEDEEEDSSVSVGDMKQKKKSKSKHSKSKHKSRRSGRHRS